MARQQGSERLRGGENMTTTSVTAGIPAARLGRRTRKIDGVKAFNRLAATCLTLFALIWLVPFLWAVITSLRTDTGITTNATTPWTGGFTFAAYAKVWESTSIGAWYLNSFIVSTLSVIFCVAACSMIAFALAHMQFRFKGPLLALILAGLMMPTEALILPQFMEFRTIGLIGTFWALILPAVAAPVAVFVFMSFLSGIPKALIEAARLDGAGWWRIYYQVCMPLCRPAISAVAILVFIGSWNSFLWPLLVLNQTQQMTLPVGLATVAGVTGIQYAEEMASAVLGILPLLAVFLVFERQIVQGIANTGIK
jgi:multiple sugar transport system permease protein